VLLSISALLVPGLAAQGPGPSASMSIPVEEAQLGNGLRVIVSTDRSAPIAAVNLRYEVGSGHETPGRSGFAHLFEHLLFGETENLADGELDRMISAAGGIVNGRTNTDRTEYTEVVPSHHLERVLWTHAERMRRLVVDEVHFLRQREIVKEERRLRIDNSPYGEAQITVDTLAQDYLPYRHSVIGSMADLDAASVAEVRDFYDRWYRPNNATLVVVGDTSLDEVLPSVRRWFGEFEPGPDPEPLPPPPNSPRSDGERRVELEDRLAQLPLTYVAWNAPPAGHPDLAALGVLSRILGSGESSRLYRSLVAERGVANQVLGQLETRLGPGLFLLGALSGPGANPSETEAALMAEVGRLLEEGPTAGEVEKARNQLRITRVAELLTVAGKAAAIQQARATRGDASAVNADLEELQGVTPVDVQRVARRWLVDANRTVVVARPAGGTP
jgi:zinc protease